MARLPVSPDRLEHRVRIYSPREWRQSPNIRVPRLFERSLDIIACEVANEVSERAQDNALRTVHFNLMADREFVNPEFERLVQFVCDFIEVRIAERSIRDVEEDLNGSIYSSVLLHCTKQVEQYGELDDHIRRTQDHSFIRAVDANIGKFRDIVRLIDELHNEDPRHMRSNEERSGGSDFRSQYSGGGGSSRDSGRFDRNSRGRDTGRNYGHDGRSTGRSSERVYGRQEPVYTARDTPETTQQHKDFDMPESQSERHQDTATTSRWTDRETQRTTHMPSSRDIMTSTSTQAQQEKKMEQSPKAPETTRVFTGIFGTIPILTPIGGQSEMDILKHSAVYGLQIPSVDLYSEAKRVLTLTQNVNSGSVTEANIGNDIVYSDEVKLHPTVQSLADGVTLDAVNSIITDSGDNIDGERKVHQYVGIVDNIFIGYNHLNDFNKGLQECKKLSDFSGIFKRTLEAVNIHAKAEAAYASDLRGVVEFFNEVLTREINGYCRSVLRISDTDAIGSFMTDLEDLVTAVHGGASNEVYEALLGFLSSLAANLSECLDPTQLIDETSRDINDVGELGMAILPMSYNVTHLPFTLTELGYKIKSAVAIDGIHVSPFLHAILTETGKVDEDPANKALQCSFRLLVTRDRKVFRVYTYPNRPHVFILVPLH